MMAHLRTRKVNNMATMKISACTTCCGNCWGCNYSDSCPQWLDEAPYTTAEVEVECAKLALCESRHTMPEDCEGAIFPQSVDPADIMRLRLQCARSLKSAVTDKGIKYLCVYVTGLTVALVEVINWCIAHHVQCIMMHYNRDTGEYYHQCLHWHKGE